MSKTVLVENLKRGDIFTHPEYPNKKFHFNSESDGDFGIHAYYGFSFEDYNNLRLRDFQAGIAPFGKNDDKIGEIFYLGDEVEVVGYEL